MKMPKKETKMAKMCSNANLWITFATLFFLLILFDMEFFYRDSLYLSI